VCVQQVDKKVWYDLCKFSNLPETPYMSRTNSIRREDMTANICISKAIIVFLSIIKGNVSSKKTFNIILCCIKKIKRTQL